jgi:Restriction endonuclease
VPCLIEHEPGTDWRDLQARVACILNECGLNSEVGRQLATARGSFEIDVHATDPTTTPPATYLCECKRWRAAVPQAEVMAFRGVVADSGAHFGLFISASGFQSGALEVVRHTNVHLVDWIGFQDMFAERWCREYWVPTFRNRADGLAGRAEPINSDAAGRHHRGESISRAEAVGLFALDMWGEPFNGLDVFAGLPPEPLLPAIWAHRDRYRGDLPPLAAEAQCLRDLLEALTGFADDWSRGDA